MPTPFPRRSEADLSIVLGVAQSIVEEKCSTGLFIQIVGGGGAIIDSLDCCVG